VALKLASTGYRFLRYYSADPLYRRKGPPHPLLRGVAPLVVGSTVAVFVTGVLLVVRGPSSGGQLVLWHKVSFFVWLAAMAPHVLGHLTQLPPWLRATGEDITAAHGPRSGSAGRAIALTSALVAGVVLAIVLVPEFGAWTSAHFHHHHG
jgi:hypothetical protein